MDEGFPNSGPQFGTAEYSEQPGENRCKSCGESIAGKYFRVSGAMTCPRCAEKTHGQLPKDTHKAFGRGLLFGAGGAVLGLILYSTVGIVTGYEIGYVSLAVGFIIGKAIMMGSWGIGGRRYQIAAVALTYAAVSMSAVPISIAFMMKEKPGTEAVQQGATAPGQPAQGQAATAQPADPDEGGEESEMSMGAAIAYLALVGLASPFLGLADPLRGIIGLVILAVGIQIAWKLTEGATVEILGPFNA